MPPTKQKGFAEQFQTLLTEVGVALTNSATKEEVKEVIDTFIQLLKQLQTTLESKLGETSSSFANESARLSGAIAEAENRLNEHVDNIVQTTSKEFSVKLNELSALVGYVADRIEYYDDTELRKTVSAMDAAIREVRQKIPKEFDPSELTRDIAELEQKYKALDEKLQSVGSKTGGGISNLRIQQAFKYILKTEEPVGAIDGANTVYTVTQTIFAVLAFSLNGEVVAQLPNYTIAGKTITFATALPAAYAGKDFEIKYI